MNHEHINNFNTFIEKNLNNSQRTAVTHQKGSLLIVAGAGSGKTRVITTRIAHLILNQHAFPSTIVALTFTNKAALEMKERIEKFLNGHYDVPFVGTFHSFCLRLLKQNSELLDTPFFSILDEDDQHKILQGIIAKSGLQKKTTAKQLSYQISQIKNQTINPETHDLYALNPMIREIYFAYEQEKKASKCLDFDDLLLEVVKLFKKNASFRKEFQEKVRHVLVDEYQDTNIVQHELLKLMALAQKNALAIDSLCAVGDEDQSIYSWRGATVSNIMNFTQDFPGTTIIKIEQNYRSVQPILDLANSVINNNLHRNPKNLWSEKKGSDRIRAVAFLSEYQEAEAIAHFLKSAVAKKQKLNTMAILYRTHFQSRAIEEALLKHSVPYKIIGGIQFYERKEIKDILAYLKLVVNPFDRPSFFRVVNCPLRGLGNKFEEQFHAAWNANLFATFKDIASFMIENKEITGTKKDALVSFIKLFDGLSHTDKPRKVVEYFITATQYFSYLKETYDQEEALSKIDNVKELIQAIDHLESEKVITIADFLDQVALMQAQIQTESNEKDPVLLMTLHAAKGLEFDTVILTGLEEGLLPSSRSLSSEESIEEERRLFYVGITRAQERLLLTYSRYRYNFGTMTDQRPSRFVQEIPNGTVPLSDASYWQNVQMSQFFSQWLCGTETFLDSRKRSLETNGKNSFREKAKLQKPFVSSDSKLVDEESRIDKEKKLLKPASSLWKKNQPVSHATFGLGIVQDIELRANGITILHIKFKTGLKKLESSYVKST
jgi:DNA helicase-2/ATP-dependent DNA helicase PcrA